MLLYFIQQHFAVIDKVLSSKQINEFGLTESGFLIRMGDGKERGAARNGGGWNGNPVPDKRLILLIPQISNVRS